MGTQTRQELLDRLSEIRAALRDCRVKGQIMTLEDGSQFSRVAYFRLREEEKEIERAIARLDAARRGGMFNRIRFGRP